MTEERTYKNPYNVQSNLNDLGWYWRDDPDIEPEGGDWFKDDWASREIPKEWLSDLMEADEASHAEMKRRCSDGSKKLEIKCGCCNGIEWATGNECRTCEGTGRLYITPNDSLMTLGGVMRGCCPHRYKRALEEKKNS